MSNFTFVLKYALSYYNRVFLFHKKYVRYLYALTKLNQLVTLDLFSLNALQHCTSIEKVPFKLASLKSEMRFVLIEYFRVRILV